MYHGTPEHRAELRSNSMRIPSAKKAKGNANTFPIIVTTYEIVIRDRKYLSRYDWKFIVVDEGHRLKNMDCK
jgi:ATP-dependent DNA helicase